MDCSTLFLETQLFRSSDIVQHKVKYVHPYQREDSGLLDSLSMEKYPVSCYNGIAFSVSRSSIATKADIASSSKLDGAAKL